MMNEQIEGHLNLIGQHVDFAQQARRAGSVNRLRDVLAALRDLTVALDRALDKALIIPPAQEAEGGFLCNVRTLRVFTDEMASRAFDQDDREFHKVCAEAKTRVDMLLFFAENRDFIKFPQGPPRKSRR
jgi:hypothetical protein